MRLITDTILKKANSYNKKYFFIIVLFLLTAFQSNRLFACADADFSVDNATPVVDETITFTDESEDADDWQWDFGEGANPGNAFGEGPHEVSYSTSGLKTVTLTATAFDVFNIPDTETKVDYINVFFCPTPAITFDGVPLFPPGGSIEISVEDNEDITSYQWTLDGEDIPGATNSTYAATEKGDYSVVVDYELTQHGDTYTCEEKESEPVTILEATLPVVDGIVIHLDAYDLEGLADGATVSEWTDLSGNNNHAGQTVTGDRPTYQTEVLNGLPVVRFDGDRLMEVTNSSSLNFSGPGLTILTVFNPLSLQNEERPLLRKDNQFQLGLFPADGSMRNLINTDGISGWTADNDEDFGWAADTPHIFGLTWDGNTIRHFVDASEIGQGAEVTGNIITNGNPLLIGGEDPDGNRIHADIGEVLVFNRALTTDERNDIENYLYDKWFGERRTWYSLVSDDWNNHLSWTLVEGESVNPDEEIPGPMDKVVIVDAKISVNQDNLSVGSIEVRSNGILDLGSTQGHNFRVISGQGRIRLSSDNFPAGYAEGFTGNNGGTVEFYGNGFELEQVHTFNHMEVNLSGNSETLTMLADYNLNGNLTINGGDFRINGNNNGEHTNVLNLTVKGDLSVSSNGRISVGQGNTAGGYQIQGGSLPGLGEYHSIFHQVRLYGDFTNNGTVRFTNQTAPDFREFAGNGAAVVTFAGEQNQEVRLEGTTGFYNLIVDKGIGQTRVVDIYSSHSNHFALYGPNNMGNRTGGEFTEQNPEVRKALWIRNGTLKLSGSMRIPSLTEGNERGGRGDYTIPSNGKLWIAGGDVRVYTTIRTQAQHPDGSGWYKGESGHTALTLFGSFRIDNGFFGTRHSAGFIYRSEDAATVKINGGIVDAASFRSSGAGGGGRTYYYQSGGQVRVRGNVPYEGEAGGEVSAAWPLFGIIFPEGVFSMSGGEILMIGRSRANNNNNYDNNAFYVASSDYNVTGGNIRLMPAGGWNYYLHSTANLWNLEMERRTGNSEVDVWLSSELVVGNDLTIGDNCTFHPRIDNGDTNHDVYIGGDFVLGESTDSNADYNSMDGTNGNTTTFFGSENSTINIVNDNGVFLFEFYDLVIDKSSHDLEVNIISNGRDAVDLKDGGPFGISPFRIRSSLTVKRGILDYGDFALVGVDENFTVENRSSIGKVGNETGFLLIDESDQIIAPLGTEPIFGNLVINNDDIVYLTGNADINIGNLGMRQGIFDIGSQGITVEEDIVNIDGPNPDFDELKLIKTAGNHSDRGVTLRIEENGEYLFPIGTMNYNDQHLRYAFARPTFTDVPAGGGYVQINGVPKRLGTLGQQKPERYLQYYWRVRHFDFSDLPNIENYFRAYEDDYFNFDAQQIVGKVVNLERLPYHPNEIGELIDLSPYRDLSYDLHELETGEFTSARSTMFNGPITVYYTRDHGNSTGETAREPRWDDHLTWTRSDHNDFDEDNPHSSSNPHAGNNNYPGVGDIAVIGWVPWDDPKEDYRGLPHGVWIDNEAIEVAAVYFTQMTDEEGKPVPRNYRSNFQFRPTLCINNNDGQLTAGWVEGEGMFWIRDGDPDMSLMDLGDFVASDSTYFVYENFDANRTYQNIPLNVSNIQFSNDGWGTTNKDVTIETDISTLGNFEILGNLNLLLNNGTTGDINVGRNLVFFETTDPLEGNASGGGAEIAFPNSGNARTITVKGDLLMQNSDALIGVREPASQGLEHNINVFGNIRQNTAGDYGNPSNGLQLYNTSENHDRIVLSLRGEESVEWLYESGDIPNLYRLFVDKGNSQASEVLVNTNLNLHGPTDDDSNEKALQLLNGKLILNHDGIDINLTTGSEPFTIPSTSGLVVSQGEVSATNSDISLSGLLRLENDGAGDFEETLLYSSSGQAALQIADDAILEVGKQIRSTTSSEGGVLKYNQSGGSVVIGTNTPDVNERGVFEVMNPGSEFFMTGGTLTIAGAQSGQERAAFYLRPNLSNVSGNAVVHIGHTSSSNETIEIDVSEDISLPALFVTQGSDVIAKLKDNDLTLRGNLEISNSNAFDGSGRHLTVRGNIINEGQTALHTDSLLMTGDLQTIEGPLILEHLVVQSATSLTLEGTVSNIDVNGNLYLNSGTLYDAENIITVFGDVHNYATHNSNGDGRILFNGDQVQEIHGSGIFGNLQVDKTDSEVRLQGPMELEDNLFLTNGLLNIDRYRFTLGANSEIVGSGDFGATQMIVSRGTFEDFGLAKRVAPGSGEFTFPIGVSGKYTPVTIEYDAGTMGASGLIAVTPVNTPHITLNQTGDEEILQFHWYVESENLEYFDGDLIFYYDPDDVEGNVDDYIAARLYDTEWGFDGFVDEDNNRIVFDLNQNNLTGDYTAGHPDDIPEEVPVYISTGSGDWAISGNWVLKGNPAHNAPVGGPSGVIAEIEPEHTITIQDNRTVVYDLTVNGTLDLEETVAHNFRNIKGNGTVVLQTRNLPSGRWGNFFSTPGSTIVYGGDTDYTITGRYSDLQNIEFDGLGERKMINPTEFSRFRVFGDVWVQESAFLNVIDWFEIRGNLSLGENAGYQVSKWSYFTGSNHQEITGDFEGERAIQNFYINKEDGSLTITNSVQIESSLYLRRGVINLQDGSHMFLKNPNGLSSSSNLDRSWINGPFTRMLDHNSTAGGNSNLFPIGNDNMRRFVRLDAPEHNSNVKPWTVHYNYENVSDAGMNPELFDQDNLHHIHHSEYWHITPPDGVADAKTHISLGYGIETDVDDELPSFEKDIAIVQWKVDQWEHADPNQAYSVDKKNKFVTTKEKVPFNASKSGGAFFTFGSKTSDTPLPIELLSFNAKLVDQWVELEWVTASEINNDFFTIERSRNGLDFDVIATVASKAENGFSNQKLFYSALDTQPLKGMNYYRLKQTDFDGSYEYSEMVGVLFQQHQGSDIALKAFPNPNRGYNFNLSLSGFQSNETLDVSVRDMNGRPAYSNRFYADNSGNVVVRIVPTGKLSPGVYLVTVTGPSGRVTSRMVVK